MFRKSVARPVEAFATQKSSGRTRDRVAGGERPGASGGAHDQARRPRPAADRASCPARPAPSTGSSAVGAGRHVSRACSAGAGRWPPARGPAPPAARAAALRCGRAARQISGTRKMRAATRHETGLPGRPSTRWAPRRPNSIGLPGRMAIFQKSSAMPRASSAGSTRSWSPTDAPPMVTSMSASAAMAAWRSSASSVSRGDAEQARLAAGALNHRGQAVGVGRHDLAGAGRACPARPARRRSPGWRRAARGAREARRSRRRRRG